MATKHSYENKVLLCTVGLPYSGKSTWARSVGFPVVSPDAIRYALHGQRYEPLAEPYVWAIAKTMVRSLFLAGHNTVILDATNISRSRRDDWQSKDWRTLFHHLTTAPDICKQRAVADEYIHPVIDRMATEFQPLGEDEKRWMPY